MYLTAITVCCRTFVERLPASYPTLYSHNALAYDRPKPYKHMSLHELPYKQLNDIDDCDKHRTNTILMVCSDSVSVESIRNTLHKYIKI